MLILLSVSVAMMASSVIAVPAPSHFSVLRRQSGPFTYFETNVPTPPVPGTTYDFRLSSTDSKWQKLDSDVAGFSLSTDGDKVGYRLSDDDTSTVVYKLDKNNTMVEVNYGYDEDSNVGGPSAEIYGTIDTTYGQSKTKRDVWSSDAGFNPVTFNKTVTVQNVECDDDLTFEVQTIDSKGQIQNYTGINNLDVAVPIYLPANITVATKEYPKAYAKLTFNGVEPLSASFGSGDNLPIIGAGLSTVVQFCPD